MATWVSRIGKGFKALVGIQPCLPQRGPDEASKGIYDGHAQQKLGVGKAPGGIDFDFSLC